MSRGGLTLFAWLMTLLVFVKTFHHIFMMKKKCHCNAPWLKPEEEHNYTELHRMMLNTISSLIVKVLLKLYINEGI